MNKNIVNKIKVLHSISSIDITIGGPARSLPAMCIGTQKYDINNTILTYSSPNPNIAVLKDTGIIVDFIEKENNAVSRFLSMDYKKHLKSVKCDIIHLHSLWTLPLHWASCHGRKSSIPVVISPRGTLERMDRVKKSIKKQIAWTLYQKSDLKKAICLHATAQQEAENLKKLGLNVPIVVIPNGLNIDNYPIKEYKESSDSIRTILFLSRIHPKKGIETLMKAWSEIEKSKREDWKVVLVGEGDPTYVSYIESLIKKDFQGYNIEYIGAKYGSEKIKEYHNADVFILPTYSENFGMVIAEAMACGLPVITTKGAPWEIIAENNAGWWVDNTVEQIKESLIQAISLSDRQREEKGRKCREIIKANFSVESITKLYVELYNWIVNKPETPPHFIYK